MRTGSEEAKLVGYKLGSYRLRTWLFKTIYGFINTLGMYSCCFFKSEKTVEYINKPAKGKCLERKARDKEKLIQ